MTPSISSKLPPAEKAWPAPCSRATFVSGIAVDGQPDVGQLAVHRRAGGVEAGPVERDAQHPLGGSVEREVGEGGVAVGGHGRPSWPAAEPPATGCHARGAPWTMTRAPNILVLCTGNATRSVIAGAVLQAHLPHVEIATGGTMSIDGLPMSWRTKAGFEAVGVTPPSHRSRQVLADDLDRATLIVGLAPEHVNWVRRTHPAAAPRTATLKRLVHDLADDHRPLAERVAELGLADVELQPWEEVVDPGGGEVEAFIACAQEVVPLVDDLAARLRLAPAMADWASEDWTGERATRWVEMADAIEAQLAPVSDELFAAAELRPGERVLDVGCGTGPTTRRAAELLAPDGDGRRCRRVARDDRRGDGTHRTRTRPSTGSRPTWRRGIPTAAVRRRHLPLRRHVLRRPARRLRQPRRPHRRRRPAVRRRVGRPWRVAVLRAPPDGGGRGAGGPRRRRRPCRPTTAVRSRSATRRR